MVEIASLCKVIGEQRPDANEYKGRAFEKECQGLYEEAIKEYDKAIELKPDDSGAYINRGHVYSELGKYRRAIKDYTKAARLNCPFAYHNRGHVEFYIGKYKQAIKDFDVVLQGIPDLGGALEARGISKAELGRYKEALIDFNKLVELNPDSSDAYYDRALIKYILGEKAEEDFSKALELKPDDLELRIHIGLSKYHVDEHRKKYINHRKWRNHLEDLAKNCYDLCKTVKNKVKDFFENPYVDLAVSVSLAFVAMPATVFLTYTGIVPLCQLIGCLAKSLYDGICEWRDERQWSHKKSSLEEKVCKTESGNQK